MLILLCAIIIFTLYCEKTNAKDIGNLLKNFYVLDDFKKKLKKKCYENLLQT